MFLEIPRQFGGMNYSKKRIGFISIVYFYMYKKNKFRTGTQTVE